MTAEPCRILVIDDDADTAESLALLCTLDGHDSRAVSDADAALELAQRFRPDIAVVDLVLRGSRLDGFALARHFRVDPVLSDVALVANTGLARPLDQSRARDAGFEHVFVKPADPRELLRLIDEVLCRRRGRRPALPSPLD